MNSITRAQLEGVARSVGEALRAQNEVLAKQREALEAQIAVLEIRLGAIEGLLGVQSVPAASTTADGAPRH